MGKGKAFRAVRYERKLHRVYSNPNLSFKQARKATKRIGQQYRKKRRKG